jgi:hypothetical protein
VPTVVPPPPPLLLIVTVAVPVPIAAAPMLVHVTVIFRPSQGTAAPFRITREPLLKIHAEAILLCRMVRPDTFVKIDGLVVDIVRVVLEARVAVLLNTVENDPADALAVPRLFPR